jgi:Holliday junction DNA helicase RuvA
LIAHLRGRLLAKDTQGAVVECAGVGYGLSMSLSSLSRLGAIGSEVGVLVHTHVTQDSLRLFGFLEAEERATFEILIGISGVGPRLALAILSTLSASELAEVVGREDKATLRRIPGIGAKTAERLLVELKHRLDRVPVGEPVPDSRASLAGDLAAALGSLGFKPAQAEDVTRATLEAHPKVGDLAALVRAALRAATKV